MLFKYLKRDDLVIATSGNNKGKTGKVLLRKGDKVWVQGLNMCIKHKKKEKIKIESPIHISNLCLCDESGKKIKKLKLKRKGKEKDLVYVRDNKEIVYRSLIKKKKIKK